MYIYIKIIRSSSSSSFDSVETIKNPVNSML